MPAIDKLKDFVDKRLSRLRKEADAHEEASGLLPDDLARQILNRSELERMRLEQRLEVTGRNLEKLGEFLKEAKARKRALMTSGTYGGGVIEKPDGSVVRKEGRPVLHMTKAAVDANELIRKIEWDIKRNKAERQQIQNQLGELVRIRKIAKGDKITPLLALARRWAVPVVHHKVEKIVPAQILYTDAAGNVLPDVAQDMDMSARSETRVDVPEIAA